MTDTEILQFFHFQLHPLLVHLYNESRLSFPMTKFDYKVEGPRLVASLREQGFSMQFPLDDSLIKKTNVKEK